MADVEIVARGYTLETVVLQKVIGGEGIGDVEREVTSLAIGGKEFEVFVVTHEIAIGLTRTHLLENPFFAGFKDPGRRDPDR